MKIFSRSIFALLIATAFLLSNSLNTVAQQEEPPAPATPRSVHFPTPVEKYLANGLRVIAVERGGSSIVTAMMLIKTGGEVDPPTLAGLADMTAGLIAKGSRKRSAPQIAEAIEALGGSLETGARWDESFAKVDVMTSNLASAIEILSDVVRNPVFSQAELSRLRQQTLDDLTLALSEPGILADFVAARVVYGSGPYGHRSSGTPETISRINRNHVAQMHARYYRPDNAILIIAGDLNSDLAFEIAEKNFAGWRKPASPLPQPVSRGIGKEVGDSQRVVVVDMDHAGQAAVMVSRAALSRTDPDYFRGIVANSVLGGGYSARLNQEIRIKRGLSYGAGSFLDFRRGAGPFIATTQTKNESGAIVAGIIIEELDRLSTAAIPDEELATRKAALIGTFARSLETTAGLAAQVGHLAIYGLGLDEINNYIRSVQSVTPGEIQTLAKNKLSARSAHIVIVGDAKAFLPELKKRFARVEVIREHELDLNRANLRRARGHSGRMRNR